MYIINWFYLLHADECEYDECDDFEKEYFSDSTTGLVLFLYTSN